MFDMVEFSKNKWKYSTIGVLAVLAAGFSFPQAFATFSYLYFDDVNVDVKSNIPINNNNQNTRIKVDLSVQDNIPLDGSGGAFGYGVFTGETLDNVLVLVTHLPLDDSNHEDPVSGFHTHVLDLMEPTQHCNDIGADLEVDLAGSVANKGFDLDADWSIDGDNGSIGYTPIKLLNNTPDVDAIVSFTVTPLENEDLHLCVFAEDVEITNGVKT